MAFVRFNERARRQPAPRVDSAGEAVQARLGPARAKARHANPSRPWTSSETACRADSQTHLQTDRMLRPFLCKGPFDMAREFTLLLGAIEANGKLDHEPEEAESLRKMLLANPTRRRKHERY